MKKELSPEAIEVAAQWWTDILTTPATHNNGDPEGFGAAMADMESAKLPLPTDEQLKTFKETLITLIKEESERYQVVIVGTDYDPYPILAKAIEAAAIENPLFRFPWKTVLWLDHRDVRVRQGYKAETKTIWQKPTAQNQETDAVS